MLKKRELNIYLFFKPEKVSAGNSSVADDLSILLKKKKMSYILCEYILRIVEAGVANENTV